MTRICFYHDQCHRIYVENNWPNIKWTNEWRTILSMNEIHISKKWMYSLSHGMIFNKINVNFRQKLCELKQLVEVLLEIIDVS